MREMRAKQKQLVPSERGSHGRMEGPLGVKMETRIESVAVSGGHDVWRTQSFVCSISCG